MGDTSPRRPRAEAPLTDAQRAYLAELYTEHAEDLRRHCRVVLGSDAAAAEDAVQEAFEATAKYMAAAKENEEELRAFPAPVLREWLKTTATRKAINQKTRRRRPDKEVLAGGEVIEAITQSPAWRRTRSQADDYDSLADFLGVMDRLKHAAVILGQKDRQLLELLIRRQASAIEMPGIAAEMKVSEVAAKMRKSRLHKPGHPFELAMFARTAGEYCEKAREITYGKPLTRDLLDEVIDHAEHCDKCKRTREKHRFLGIIGLFGLPFHHGIFSFLFRRRRPRDPSLRDVADSQDLAPDAGTADPQQPAAPAAGAGATAGRATISRRPWLAVSAVALLILGLGLGLFATHPGWPTSLSGAIARPSASASARPFVSGVSRQRASLPATTVRPSASPAGQGSGLPGPGRAPAQRADDRGSRLSSGGKTVSPSTTQTTPSTTQTTPSPPVITPPTASLAVSQTGNGTAQADASGSTAGSAPISTYSFDWGDGQATTGQASPTATHTYTADGTYTVTSTVTDTAGNTVQATTEINVVPLTGPIASQGYCLETYSGVGTCDGSASQQWTIALAGTHYELKDSSGNCMTGPESDPQPCTGSDQSSDEQLFDMNGDGTITESSNPSMCLTNQYNYWYHFTTCDESAGQTWSLPVYDASRGS